MKWFSTSNSVDKEQNARSEGIDVRVLRRLGWLPTQLEVESNANVNRYKFVPAAILNHVCLGGV